ncbi:4-hydroxy-3-methylbut-2-enyl diphosphate reductase [Candidatus Sumerlaeota bacterium]|nr:4-hydroxy-3-methylbut-2-enyl diphosphate reductase [Candidatus Sumerlaeota bacterium]
MTIILARTAGFCYGVRRAVTLALSQAQKEEGRLATIGPLVHNQQAIDLLESRNISIINDPDELRKEDRVLIRAHGIIPSLRKEIQEKCSEICDATCPHVTSTQRIVERHAEKGYACLIVGDRGHAEVAGLVGYSSGKGMVIESEKDIEHVPQNEKICVVAQTTQNVEFYKEITNLIREKFPDALIFDTICRATAQRQEELAEIAGKSDVVVIVGGKKSANTRRLVEIAKSMGKRTYHVETAQDLNLDEINPRDVIGVTAGASTPHWVIRNVVETLADFQLRKQFFLFRFLVSALRFLVYSSIFLSLGGAFLTYSAAHLMGLSDYYLNILLAFFFILSMHLINKRLSLPRDVNLLYGSQKRFARYKDAFTILALLCIVFSLMIAFYRGKGVFTLVLLSVVLGFFYSLTILPQRLIASFRNRRLMDIPGSKDIFMALAWGLVVVFIPYMFSTVKNLPAFLFSFALVAILVFLRSILLDGRDLEGDIALGKETIPIVLGSRISQIMIRIMMVIIAVIPLTGWLSGVLPPSSILLVILFPYLLLHYPISNRQAMYQSLFYDGYLEGQFFLSGTLLFLWEMVKKGM